MMLTEGGRLESCSEVGAGARSRPRPRAPLVALRTNTGGRGGGVFRAGFTVRLQGQTRKRLNKAQSPPTPNQAPQPLTYAQVQVLGPLIGVVGARRPRLQDPLIFLWQGKVGT